MHYDRRQQRFGDTDSNMEGPKNIDSIRPDKTEVLCTADGCRFEVAVYKGDQGAPRTILCFPAMGIRGEYYRELASTLRDIGFNVIVGELRGTGSHSLRASRHHDWGYADMAEQEWPAVVACAKRLFPNAALCFLGHSIGGQISSLYLATNPEVSQELILVASNSMGYKKYGLRGYGVLALSHVVAFGSRVLGYWPGHKLGFMGRQARGEMQDWARNTLTNQYRLGQSKVDYESRFSRYKGRVLSISIEKDWMTPAPSVISLMNKFICAKTTYTHLVNIETEDGAVSHINWPRYPQKILPTLLSWFNRDTVSETI